MIEFSFTEIEKESSANKQVWIHFDMILMPRLLQKMFYCTVPVSMFLNLLCNINVVLREAFKRLSMCPGSQGRFSNAESACSSGSLKLLKQFCIATEATELMLLTPAINH